MLNWSRLPIWIRIFRWLYNSRKIEQNWEALFFLIFFEHTDTCCQPGSESAVLPNYETMLRPVAFAFNSTSRAPTMVWISIWKIAFNISWSQTSWLRQLAGISLLLHLSVWFHIRKYGDPYLTNLVVTNMIGMH